MKRITLTIVMITLIMVTISPIFAIEIVSNNLTIIVYNNSIQVYNPYRPSDVNIFSFTIINDTNNSNPFVQNQSFIFYDLFVNNASTQVIDVDTYSQLLTCTANLNQLNTSLNTCQASVIDKSAIQGNLTQCLVTQQQYIGQITNLNTANSTCKSSQNSPFLYAIGAALITAAGFLAYGRFKQGGSVGPKTGWNPSGPS